MQNLLMDYIAVTGTNRLLRRNKDWRRLLSASAVFAVLGLLLVLFVKNRVFCQLITHFLLNTGMIYVCFGKNSRQEFLENWMVTYFLVMLLGGGMEWMKEQELFLANSLPQLMFVLLTFFFAIGYLGQLRTFGNHIFPVVIKNNGKKVEVRAYWDSGNQLRDPYTGREVCILNKKVAMELMELSSVHMRLVPYSSLGEEHGLLRVVDVEELTIGKGRDETVFKDAVIGIAEGELLEKKEYDLILHATMLNVHRKRNIREVKKEAG